MNLWIQVACDPGQAHVAVIRSERLSEDKLVDYALWRPGSPDGVGDLHQGRVVSVVPAMAGAFVALDGAEGFLPDSAGAKRLTVGEGVQVTVTRAAMGGKGPRLSLHARSDGEIGLLTRGPDAVRRLAERYADAPVLVDEAGAAARLRGMLGQRVGYSVERLPESVAAAIEALRLPEMVLADGARLSIWPTPALTAIDVDAGGMIGRERHRQINRIVLPALAEQIRLRELSGAIVVDLAGLAIRQRAALAPDVEAALANDPLQPKFLGFTALGLAEILRRRVHAPLHEALAGPLAAGLEGLKAMVAAFDGVRLPGLRAHPTIIAALEADAVGLEDMMHRTGHAAVLRSDPTLSGWMMEAEHG